ncbi:MAG: hypothetical protein M3R65_11770 [Gemmatimonadota bacterium]|nr:hypothetical protein [Gemmatimonadota bacterium]
MGWRDATIDVDMKLVPENDDLLRAIPLLKEKLEINVELVAPSDFIPEVPGWEDRSKFISDEHGLAFYHYDFYSQALSKIERRHPRDVLDVHAMLDRGLVERDRLQKLYDMIEPVLFRYPAIDPPSFRKAVEAVTHIRRDVE